MVCLANGANVLIDIDQGIRRFRSMANAPICSTEALRVKSPSRVASYYMLALSYSPNRLSLKFLHHSYQGYGHATSVVDQMFNRPIPTGQIKRFTTHRCHQLDPTEAFGLRARFAQAED